MKNAKIILLLCFPTLVLAGEPPQKNQQEISHLFTYLEESGCEFYRNGDWHDAERAVAHINRKYKWLRRRDLVGTTEEFIDRAATESSRSGEAYLVRCPNQKPVTSADWLRAELQRYRKQH